MTRDKLAEVTGEKEGTDQPWGLSTLKTRTSYTPSIRESMKVHEEVCEGFPESKIKIGGEKKWKHRD